MGIDLAAFAGLYYLKIDDDVPKTRGYGRSDYGHGTGAYSLMLDARTNFANAYALSAVAQLWGSSEALAGKSV